MSWKVPGPISRAALAILLAAGVLPIQVGRLIALRWKVAAGMVGEMTREQKYLEWMRWLVRSGRFKK